VVLNDFKGVPMSGSDKLAILEGVRVEGCNIGDGVDGGGWILVEDAQDGPFVKPSECFGATTGF